MDLDFMRARHAFPFLSTVAEEVAFLDSHPNGWWIESCCRNDGCGWCLSPPEVVEGDSWEEEPAIIIWLDLSIAVWMITPVEAV